MNSGYNRSIEQMKRRGQELAQQARREQQQRDTERRHREQINALSRSQRNQGQAHSSSSSSGLSSSPMSLGAMLLILLLGAAAIAGGTYLQSGPGVTGSEPTAVAEQTLDMQTVAENLAADEELPDPAEATEAEPAIQAEAPTDEASVDADTSGSLLNFDESIQQALVSGERTAWQAGPASGFVSVSALVVAGGKSCRSLVAETVEPQKAASTSPETWCEDVSGRWAKR